MCGYKKIKIEYIMMAVAFASVVWSISYFCIFFITFSSRFHYNSMKHLWQKSGRGVGAGPGDIGSRGEEAGREGDLLVDCVVF